MFIGHPLGSLLSGVISDAFGRQKAMKIVVAPTVIAFIILGYAQSFAVISMAVLMLSFLFGLKDSPIAVYISEIRY